MRNFNIGVEKTFFSCHIVAQGTMSSSRAPQVKDANGLATPVLPWRLMGPSEAILILLQHSSHSLAHGPVLCRAMVQLAQGPQQ